MPSQHMTTNEVGLAARTVKDDIPYSAEIRNILNGVDNRFTRNVN